MRVLGELPLVEADDGEVLVAEGDRDDCAFVIVAGRASVTQGARLLTTLGVGDLFGEVALVGGGVRTATVSATTALQMLRVDQETLSKLTGTQTVAWDALQPLIERGTVAGPAVDGRRGDAPAPGGGAHLGIAERVVVSPGVGTFAPRDPAAASEGEPIDAGCLLGVVVSLDGEAEVRSPFAGFFMGLLALPGERVHRGQPIAWLRTY